jgi:hypothetical protein
MHISEAEEKINNKYKHPIRVDTMGKPIYADDNANHALEMIEAKATAAQNMASAQRLYKEGESYILRGFQCPEIRGSTAFFSVHLPLIPRPPGVPGGTGGSRKRVLWYECPLGFWDSGPRTRLPV